MERRIDFMTFEREPTNTDEVDESAAAQLRVIFKDIGQLKGKIREIDFVESFP